MDDIDFIFSKYYYFKMYSLHVHNTLRVVNYVSKLVSNIEENRESSDYMF